MRSLLRFPSQPTVLALGAHADDIELGCGATLLRLKQRLEAEIHCVVFCDHFARPTFVARRHEVLRSAELNGFASYDVLGFRDTDLPNDWHQVQDRIANLRDLMAPHLVLAPHPSDLHQDHCVVADAARREFRYGEALWHYEVGQFGVTPVFRPNIFVDVSAPSGVDEPDYRQFLDGRADSYAMRKVFILRSCMTSQLEKPYLDETVMIGQMRTRGMQAAPEVRFAEAFDGRILVAE